MPLRPWLLSMTVLAAFGGGWLAVPAVPAGAAEPVPSGRSAAPTLPAVSAANGKIEALGGTLSDEALFGARGSLSIPLAPQFGFQVDGLATGFDGRFLGGLAGHFFWRNPAVGLLGIYASHIYWDKFGGAHATQVAGEVEYYWDRWTLQAVAGVEFGNTTSTFTVLPAGTFVDTIDIKTRFFDKIDLSYYLTDDFRVILGHRYVFGRNAAALGAEWGFPISHNMTASLFAEGRVGEDDYRGVWGGVRVYFGAPAKPLIRRHREDDPANWMPDPPPTQRAFVPAPAPPPPPPPELD